MKQYLPLIALSAFLGLAAPAEIPAAHAAPVSASALQGIAPGIIEPVRRHRRHRADNRYSGRGVPFFIVPGFYWGPAWWDANARNRLNRKCNNWIFAC